MAVCGGGGRGVIVGGVCVSQGGAGVARGEEEGQVRGVRVGGDMREEEGGWEVRGEEEGLKC